MREGKPVVKVTSAFLYRGRFFDHQNAFETIDEDDYAVELKTEADIAVLKSKEWLEWADDAPKVTTGDTLIFRLQTEIFYKTQTTIAKIAVSGHVYLRNQLKELIPVASVDYEKENVRGNPIRAYLERHGKVVGLLVPLDNGGYTIPSPPNANALCALHASEPYAIFLATLIQSTSIPTLSITPILKPPSHMECGRKIRRKFSRSRKPRSCLRVGCCLCFSTDVPSQRPDLKRVLRSCSSTTVTLKSSTLQI
jgi:hypothetical protein